MFNFLVASGAKAWDEGIFTFSKSRVAVEYTEDSISERYRELQPEVRDELCQLPTLFCTEREESPSRVGYINSIRINDDDVTIEFSFDDRVPPLIKGTIEDLFIHLSLGRFEMYRTHWAVKEGDLSSILIKKKIIPPDIIINKFKTISSQNIAVPPLSNSEIDSRKQIFIVHGHDDVTKYEMSSAIKELGLEPIILHEQASGGMTIIEKIEHYSDVGFAVVLYTPCDLGGVKPQTDVLELHSRARQNVVFEHGYLIGKLGRKRVMAFVKESVETPNDISGVVYINLDKNQQWKRDLKKELKKAGYIV